MNAIVCSEFAKLANISDRKAREALSKCYSGNLWRENRLAVSMVTGSKGQGGKQYLVEVSSLPTELQERFHELRKRNAVSAYSPPEGQAASKEHEWKVSMIRPILEHTKGSAGRANEFDRLSGQHVVDWQGRRKTLKKSTLQLWVRTFEDSGQLYLSLASKTRADKGKPRVIISRAWDSNVSLSDDKKLEILSKITKEIQTLVANGATLKQVRILGQKELKDLTLAHGFEAVANFNSPEMFKVPEKLIQQQSRFKAVHLHNSDRKASEDNNARITRFISNDDEPMKIVVVDVHHINVLIEREDSTTATPKLLAFYDIATGRVFWHLAFFNKRGSVRNIDQITATVDMLNNPSFGVPQYIYADNGSEYNFVDDLQDLLQLGVQLKVFSSAEERNRVIRATPYNAAAKHVEGWFKDFNQQLMQHIEGYIGDNRHAPKSPKIGKLPVFKGGFEAFVKIVEGLMQAYEHMPQDGQHLKGRSPAQVFKSWVQRGWQATIMDPTDAKYVFTREETRVLDRHTFKVAGRKWFCKKLLAYFDKKIIVHIPKYHGFSELLITDLDGNEIGIARTDTPFHVLDTRGAVESRDRKSTRNKHLVEMGKSVGKVDMVEKLIAYGESFDPVEPNEPDGVVRIQTHRSSGRALDPISPEMNEFINEDEEIDEIDAARRALASAGNS
ncbi:hypothetical protein [Pseudovibrio sp. POLY-S9]|uniref:hypothetical protein n=1 Tax=Pseudovibrio sp. POLY-S9 TaxID=1576596 RepID=UPI00070B485E|nr:hypothetical protein [Pseudovibrio sp. POLY-S9]